MDRNNTNIDYDGSQTFWKNMLREYERKIGGGKMQSLANYVVQQRKGIIEDLIAQHDF